MAFTAIALICSMAFTVSAMTHKKNQYTSYPTTNPKIKITSGVHANFDSSRNITSAYVGMRYDEYNANDNLTGSSDYGMMYAIVTMGRYTWIPQRFQNQKC